MPVLMTVEIPGADTAFAEGMRHAGVLDELQRPRGFGVIGVAPPARATGRSRGGLARGLQAFRRGPLRAQGCRLWSSLS
jgi:hypothetical protein